MLSAAGVAAVCAVVSAGIACAAVAGATVTAVACAAAVAVCCTCYITDNAVRGTENRAKATAGLRCSGGRKHIHRETDIFKIRAGVARAANSCAAFRQASAKGIYHHVYGAVQFYDAEQTKRDIDSHRRAHCRIAAATATAAAIIAAAVAATAAATVAGAACGVSQVGRQRDCLAFCHNERSAVGVAAAVEKVGRCCNFGFCGAKQRHAHVVCVRSVDAANRAAICTLEFQHIFENVFQFQVPAAFLEGIGFLPQNVDAFQFQVVNADISGVAGGHDDVALAKHFVAVGYGVFRSARGSENVSSQTFLDTALVKDFLRNDAGFAFRCIFPADTAAATVTTTVRVAVVVTAIVAAVITIVVTVITAVAVPCT